MLGFAVAAGLVLSFALAALVLPLLRNSADRAVVERNEANLQILRDQLAELDMDLRNGTLSPEHHDSARADLERRVLDESQRTGASTGWAPDGRRWLVPALIVVLVPAVSVALYAHLGNTDGMDVAAYLKQRSAEITPERIAEMTQRLEEHLEANPKDAEGWTMLGRARRALQQFDESAQAWGRAAALQPNDASVLADYAEALAIAAQGDLAGEPTRLLARALELDPTNTKALALNGSAAFGRGDYPVAIASWQKLLELSAGDDDLSNALRTGIAEAQSRITQDIGETGTSGAIAGEVSLSPKLSQSVGPDDTVFIFARAAQGPGMPLAVKRVKVSELPYQFRLDDSMAIMPERKISDVEQLVVGARVSKTGGATRASGDLEGFSETVSAGTDNVLVVIDQQVP